MKKIEWDDIDGGNYCYDSIFGNVDGYECYVLRAEGDGWKAHHISARGDEYPLGSGTNTYAKHLCLDHLDGNTRVHRWLPVTDEVKPPYDVGLLIAGEENDSKYVLNCVRIEGVGYVCPGGLIVQDCGWFMLLPKHPKH